MKNEAAVKLLKKGESIFIRDFCCAESRFERETFKLCIGGSTASNACSMQGYKNESEGEILWGVYY